MPMKTANMNARPLPDREAMTAAEFDQMMTAGLAQAKADDSFDADEVFSELEAGFEG